MNSTIACQTAGSSPIAFAAGNAALIINAAAHERAIALRENPFVLEMFMTRKIRRLFEPCHCRDRTLRLASAGKALP
jgi:hypothetical protein